MIQTFDIKEPDEGLRPALVEKVDNLTKPKGSLGRLEELAVRVGMAQRTLSPSLRRPCHVLFAADHGIEAEGVSVSPREVTWQQTLHFLRGGAGINFLCRQHGFELKVVDAGVDYDFAGVAGLIDLKVRRGSRNFLREAALTREELEACVERGAAVVDGCREEGCEVIAFGEMGVGNTSASSMWMHFLTGIPLRDCVGAGSGLNDRGVAHKLEVLTRAAERYQGDGSAWDVVREFGGLEMAMAVGAMLRAAERGMIVLVDGFIMTCCMLAAERVCPAVRGYAVFGHRGDESGHRRLLDYMGARPLLDLGLRLGEGSGAVCAFPILDSAVRMINEMDSFAGASVSKYF